MIEKIYEAFLSHPKICTDTRNIQADSLFFCLKGENFDGNTFALQALEAGAAYVVTNRQDLRGNERCFVVDDTLATLQQLARHHRRQFSIPFIGITGTNGKTTTKELTAQVLQTKYRVNFTQGNLNNHIGVPLTLLTVNADTEIAIIEMGANHPGEIADLCRIAEPTHGLITNIGVAHIEGFGSPENIVKTKRALYESVMERKGTVFVNAADAILAECAGKYQPQVRYGNASDSICQGHITDMNPCLTIEAEGVSIATHLTGEYNLNNLLGAMAVGKHFGVSNEQAAQSIEAYIPSNHRSQIIQAGSSTVIADYYNANPTSMTAALLNLAHLPHPDKCAILGDMLELGSVSEQEHRNIISLCHEHHIQPIFVGQIFHQLAPEQAFENVEQANQYLASHPIHHAMILIKGSRGIHLEKISTENFS